MGKCKAGQATGQSRCDGQPGQQRDCCIENLPEHRQSWEGARLTGAGVVFFFFPFFFFLLIDSAKETAVLYSNKFCKERFSLFAPITGSWALLSCPARWCAAALCLHSAARAASSLLQCASALPCPYQGVKATLLSLSYLHLLYICCVAWPSHSVCLPLCCTCPAPQVSSGRVNGHPSTAASQ